MNVPLFTNAKFVDKDGYLTDVWKNIIIQLLDQLEYSFSETGIVVPSLEGTDVAKIVKDNTLISNSSLNKLQILLNGQLKTISTN